MQAPLAAKLKLEMFDGVGDEYLTSIDACLAESAVEYAACRSHEGAAREIFVVAWLLPHEHHAGWYGPLAGHDLGGGSIERTSPACRLGVS